MRPVQADFCRSGRGFNSNLQYLMSSARVWTFLTEQKYSEFHYKITDSQNLDVANGPRCKFVTVCIAIAEKGRRFHILLQ